MGFLLHTKLSVQQPPAQFDTIARGVSCHGLAVKTSSNARDPILNWYVEAAQLLLLRAAATAAATAQSQLLPARQTGHAQAAMRVPMRDV